MLPGPLLPALPPRRASSSQRPPSAATRHGPRRRRRIGPQRATGLRAARLRGQAVGRDGTGAHARVLVRVGGDVGDEFLGREREEAGEVEGGVRGEGSGGGGCGCGV